MTVEQLIALLEKTDKQKEVVISTSLKLGFSQISKVKEQEDQITLVSDKP